MEKLELNIALTAKVSVGCWSAWTPFPAHAPYSNFLPKQTLAGSSNGSDIWVAATHVRVCPWFLAVALVQSLPFQKLGSN